MDPPVCRPVSTAPPSQGGTFLDEPPLRQDRGGCTGRPLQRRSGNRSAIAFPTRGGPSRSSLASKLAFQRALRSRRSNPPTRRVRTCPALRSIVVVHGAVRRLRRLSLVRWWGGQMRLDAAASLPAPVHGISSLAGTGTGPVSEAMTAGPCPPSPSLWPMAVRPMAVPIAASLSDRMSLLDPRSRTCGTPRAGWLRARVPEGPLPAAARAPGRTWPRPGSRRGKLRPAAPCLRLLPFRLPGDGGGPTKATDYAHRQQRFGESEDPWIVAARGAAEASKERDKAGCRGSPPRRVDAVTRPGRSSSC